MSNYPCEKILQDMFCMSFDRGREFTNPWEHGIHPRPRCAGDCNALCLVRNHLVHRMPRPVRAKENVRNPESFVLEVFEKDSWIGRAKRLRTANNYTLLEKALTTCHQDSALLVISSAPLESGGSRRFQFRAQCPFFYINFRTCHLGVLWRCSASAPRSALQASSKNVERV